MVDSLEQLLADVDLCYDRSIGFIKPFQYFVSCRHEDEVYKGTLRNFRNLSREIQHMVLESCDSATQWQLMRISQFRDIVSKSFWSDTQVWYLIPERWWELHKNNDHYAMPTRIEGGFASKVTRIVLSMGTIRWGIGDYDGRADFDDGQPPDLKQRYANLWDGISTDFPAVRNVMLLLTDIVLTRDNHREGLSTPETETMHSLLLSAPLHINFKIAAPERTSRWAHEEAGHYHFIWCERSDTVERAQLGFRRSEGHWPGVIVCAPESKLPHGCLRDFETMRELGVLWYLNKGGTWWQVREACKRNTDSDQSCFSRDDRSRVKICKHASEHIRNVLIVKRKRIRHILDRQRLLWNKMITEMGPYDSTAGSQYENNLKEEIRRQYCFADVGANAKDARHERLISSIMHEFYEFFDPSYGYYCPLGDAPNEFPYDDHTSGNTYKADSEDGVSENEFER